MQPTNLIVPIVHLNGTSRTELLALRERAYAALGDAIESLKQMAPNGRDWSRVGRGLKDACRRVGTPATFNEGAGDAAVD